MNVHTPNPSALSTRAMLVSLSISHWSAHRYDRDVTKEVNDNHGASKDAGRYNKLLIEKDALKEINSIVSKTRKEFIDRTLPWMDDGQRIMAADAYQAHVNWLNKQKSVFDTAVQQFLTDYPKYVNAARVRLNGMFKDEDYPDASRLARKFDMDISVMPVQTASDFRVAMGDGQAELIRRDIEASVKSATDAAVADIYRRVSKALERMVERLRAYRPSKGKGHRAEGIFHDSLVENIRDLVSVMPALNITGDPRIAALADELTGLARFDADYLRSDEEVRKNVANEAEAILTKVSDFI